MRKFGFTLAEVLITLAIVGLIAALTLPGLNSNVNNRRIGPALAKAINNLENANRIILVEQNINTVDEQGFDEYLQFLSDALNGDRDDNVITGKDGIIYTIEDPSVARTRVTRGTANSKYSGSAFRVGIDINGSKRPNLANSDRFLVYVDTRGPVIPAGGLEINNYNGNKNRLATCAENATVNSAPTTGGVDYYGMCTEAVINAGWEVKYVPVSSPNAPKNSNSGASWSIN